jgi:hypothetical protein
MELCAFINSKNEDGDEDEETLIYKNVFFNLHDRVTLNVQAQIQTPSKQLVLRTKKRNTAYAVQY